MTIRDQALAVLSDQIDSALGRLSGGQHAAKCEAHADVAEALRVLLLCQRQSLADGRRQLLTAGSSGAAIGAVIAAGVEFAKWYAQ